MMKKMKIKMLYVAMDMIVYTMAAIDVLNRFVKGGEM